MKICLAASNIKRVAERLFLFLLSANCEFYGIIKEDILRKPVDIQNALKTSKRFIVICSQQTQDVSETYFRHPQRTKRYPRKSQLYTLETLHRKCIKNSVLLRYLRCRNIVLLLENHQQCCTRIHSVDRKMKK